MLSSPGFTGVNSDVYEVLDMTGFVNLFAFE